MRRVIRGTCLAFFLSVCVRWAGAQVIAVTSPAYRADVNGTTMIQVSASGFKGPLEARSWLPEGELGSDSVVAAVKLNSSGEGSFQFRADRYPHGPITVRIRGTRSSDGSADTCYLQLYNTGGVHWNEGAPKDPPPGAEGMKLVYKDDFDGPLSISATGVGARYGAHKPDHLDFSKIPFADPTPDGPFFQRDTYLIIRADAARNTTGLISSVNAKDATGFTVTAPYYMECRFIAPDAIGTWPAWWVLTDEFKDGKWGQTSDELDIIEAYGGDGPKNPNSPDAYLITPHLWGDHHNGGGSRPVDMTKVGGRGGWAVTPHTYGLLVTKEAIVFFLDDRKVVELPPFPLAVSDPTYFMVNLAAGGGGWPLDLSRYGGAVDMYVDYIRVFQGAVRKYADSNSEHP